LTLHTQIPANNSITIIRDALSGPLKPLTLHRQFILYRLEPKFDGKLDKIPSDPKNWGRINAHAPENWMNAETACSIAEQLGTSWGVGFVLTKDDDLWCLDIDNALQADNQWSPLSHLLCSKLPGAAIEISVSQRGLHIWGSGKVPNHASKNTLHHIELYTNKRFIALSGLSAKGNAASRLENELSALVTDYFPEKFDTDNTSALWTDTPCRGWSGPLDDDELIRIALKRPKILSPKEAFTGVKYASFLDLWTGNKIALAQSWPGENRPFDSSSADFALARELAYWTGKNCQRIERLMRQSALIRDKWNERRNATTYLRETILSACTDQLRYLGDQISTAASDHVAAGFSKNNSSTPYAILTRGSDVEPTIVDWLWNGWMAAGKLHLIGGAPGTGKTTLATSLAATVSCGGLWPDGTQATAGSVVFWSGEDDNADTLNPRLRAAGANMSCVFTIDGVREGDTRYPFDPARDMEALRSALKDIPDVRLIVIDPVVSAINGDSHKNAEVRRGLQPLVDLAGELRCALLGVTHFSKGTSGRDPVERITGSLAFGALARLVMVTAKQEANDNRPEQRVLLRAKSNIGPDGGGFIYQLEQNELPGHTDIKASSVRWGESILGNARTLLSEAEQPDGDQGSDAVSFLRSLLVGGTRAVKEIIREARDAGYSSDAMHRAKRKIGAKAKKIGMAGGWLWHLPNLEDGEDGAQIKPPTSPSSDLLPPALNDW
jgi:putative DNA primase/helicase